MRVKVPAVPEDPWNEGGRTTPERPYVVTAKLSTYLEERGLGGKSYRRAAGDNVDKLDTLCNRTSQRMKQRLRRWFRRAAHAFKTVTADTGTESPRLSGRQRAQPAAGSTSPLRISRGSAAGPQFISCSMLLRLFGTWLCGKGLTVPRDSVSDRQNTLWLDHQLGHSVCMLIAQRLC